MTMTRPEIEAMAETFGMSNVAGALAHLLNATGWVKPPAPTYIGGRHNRPGTAYRALVKRGLAETDGSGSFRLLCDKDAG